MPPQKETTMFETTMIENLLIAFAPLFIIVAGAVAVTVAVTRIVIIASANYPTVVAVVLHGIYETINAIERWEYRHFKTCLLYTSPSPRD